MCNRGNLQLSVKSSCMIAALYLKNLCGFCSKASHLRHLWHVINQKFTNLQTENPLFCVILKHKFQCYCYEIQCCSTQHWRDQILKWYRANCCINKFIDEEVQDPIQVVYYNETKTQEIQESRNRRNRIEASTRQPWNDSTWQKTQETQGLRRKPDQLDTNNPD